MARGVAGAEEELAHEAREVVDALHDVGPRVIAAGHAGLAGLAGTGLGPVLAVYVVAPEVGRVLPQVRLDARAPGAEVVVLPPVRQAPAHHVDGQQGGAGAHGADQALPQGVQAQARGQDGLVGQRAPHAHVLARAQEGGPRRARGDPGEAVQLQLAEVGRQPVHLEVALDEAQQGPVEAQRLAQQAELVGRLVPAQQRGVPVGGDVRQRPQQGRVERGVALDGGAPRLLQARDALHREGAGGLRPRPVRGVVERLAQLVAQGGHASEVGAAPRVPLGEEPGLGGHVGGQHAGHVLHGGEQDHVPMVPAEGRLGLGRRREQAVHPGVDAGAGLEGRALDRAARVQAQQQAEDEVEQDALRVGERGGVRRVPEAGQALLQDRREGSGQRAPGEEAVDDLPEIREQVEVRGVGDREHELVAQRGPGQLVGEARRQQERVELPVRHLGRYRPVPGQTVQGAYLASEARVVGEELLFLVGSRRLVPLKQGGGCHLYAPPVLQPVDRQAASVLEGR